MSNVAFVSHGWPHKLLLCRHQINDDQRVVVFVNVLCRLELWQVVVLPGSVCFFVSGGSLCGCGWPLVLDWPCRIETFTVDDAHGRSGGAWRADIHGLLCVLLPLSHAPHAMLSFEQVARRNNASY